MLKKNHIKVISMHREQCVCVREVWEHREKLLRSFTNKGVNAVSDFSSGKIYSNKRLEMFEIENLSQWMISLW